jgi:hypothetical protein
MKRRRIKGKEEGEKDQMEENRFKLSGTLPRRRRN